MITKESLELKLVKCKTLINDDLAEFKTINKLLNKSNPDLDNIKYICGSTIKTVENFIDNFDINIEELEIIQENKNKQINFRVEDIKTYNDILLILDKKNQEINEDVLDPEERCINAFKKLLNIVKVFNQGWIPDWDNKNEYKYYPYFYMNKNGGGFRLGDMGYHLVNSAVTARLCFKTK